MSSFWHKNVLFGIRFRNYIYRFRVYTSKEDPMTSVLAILPAECQNFGVSEKVVVYLTLPLVDQGFTLWMDNWYSSCKLYQYLHYNENTADSQASTAKSHGFIQLQSHTY